MQITSLNIENVLGAGEVSLDLAGRRLGLIAGEHATGKSSCAEAVRLCLRGVSERAPAKKDWRLLVRDGAQSGMVRIQFAGGESARLMLPTGAGSSPLAGLDEVRAQAWALVLGHQQMSAMKPKERRALVTRLLGEESAHDKIAAALLRRGLEAVKVETITPMLRAGLEAANKDALDFAREAKASWRAITGEDWGAKKAPGWPATDPGPKPMRTASAVFGAASTVSQAMEALQRQIGAAGAVVGEEELAQLRKTAATAEACELKRAAASHRVQALVEAVADLERRIATGGQGTPLTCPCCSTRLVYKDAALEKAQELPEGWLNAVRAELADKKSELAAQRLKLDAAARAAGEAEVAVRRVNAAEAAAAVDVDALKDQHQARKDEHDRLMAEIEQIRAYEAWTKRRDNALRYHQDVMAWLEISQALQDPELSASESASAGERLNLELASITAGIGWKGVEIGDEGELRYAGRPVAFCSESERWRADAVCAIAIAKLAGLGLVLLDRLDILLPKVRAPFLRWLTLDSGLETVLAFAAMKERPQMPDSVAVVWLGTEIPEAEVAA
ncbi:MAG TPA: hypothetical protein VFA75_07215 [Nevskia sp.]|nr:hypothetical protein [Nevskia sp.]